MVIRNGLEKYPASEILIELSEYPLSSDPENGLDLNEFGFVYDKSYLKEELAHDMSERPKKTMEETATDFAEEAQANQVHTFQYLNNSNNAARQNEIHSFITELMSEIPEEILWLDTRQYHEFKQKSKYWLSVDALIIPHSDAYHVVVFHMLPPGGLLFKEKSGSGWTMKMKDLRTLVWMEKFAPNKTAFQYPKLDEDSIVIIEVKKVVYMLSGDGNQTPHFTENSIEFENVGMGILNLMMPTGEFANGHYQIPLVKEAIDFANISDQLDGEANALGIVKELYEQKFKEGSLLDHSSLFLSIYEDNFPVSDVDQVLTEKRLEEKPTGGRPVQ